MNKLTIEHMAPYLPYDLEVMAGGRRGYFLVPQLNTSKHEREVTVSALMGISQDYYKPILRPLSQVEEYFKPLFEEGDKEIVKYLDSDFLYEYNINVSDIENYEVEYLPVGLYRLLLKHHFDVFGLTEQGLAVEKK